MAPVRQARSSCMTPRMSLCASGTCGNELREDPDMHPPSQLDPSRMHATVETVRYPGTTTSALLSPRHPTRNLHIAHDVLRWKPVPIVDWILLAASFHCSRPADNVLLRAVPPPRPKQSLWPLECRQRRFRRLAGQAVGTVHRTSITSTSSIRNRKWHRRQVGRATNATRLPASATLDSATTQTG